MSCIPKRDPNGTWRIQYRWKDYTGKSCKSQKRGFRTKKEAEEWYMQFMLQQSDDITMTLSKFWEVYKDDMKSRIRETTMRNKEYIVRDKILPYFGDTPLNEITAPKIRKWQSSLMEKGYKPTYLKTINNQLSAILNYAVNYYDLKSNPCHKAGSMGKSYADKMEYWTLDEFNSFEDAIVDKQTSWIAFKILFWTGMRLGEMLALTIGDIDFDNGVIEISKSLARLDGKDKVTPPKTEASKRIITMSQELKQDLQEYKIHLHCLRHSHASMLVQMGFSPLEIANRLGHGRVTTTIETYCHPTMDAQQRIADRLSAMETEQEDKKVNQRMTEASGQGKE